MIVAGLVFGGGFLAMLVWQLLIEWVFPAPVLVQAGPVLIVVLALAFWLLINTRLLLVLPGSAVGAGVTLRASCFLMARSAWRVAAALLLAASPAILVAVVSPTLFLSEAATAVSFWTGLAALIQATVWTLSLGASAGVAAIVFRMVCDSLTVSQPLQASVP
ncbi:hypothetical protein [Algihabitans albus]|uniref:hypothetical protein n=1 Tax=Algihabitans albus TaxID=2164067 RepID=UPI0013C30C12|nr:hypothetical protein [Algihabitans albus]